MYLEYNKLMDTLKVLNEVPHVNDAFTVSLLMMEYLRENTVTSPDSFFSAYMGIPVFVDPSLEGYEWHLGYPWCDNTRE